MNWMLVSLKSLVPVTRNYSKALLRSRLNQDEPACSASSRRQDFLDRLIQLRGALCLPCQPCFRGPEVDVKEALKPLAEETLLKSCR